MTGKFCARACSSQPEYRPYGNMMKLTKAMIVRCGICLMLITVMLIWAVMRNMTKCYEKDDNGAGNSESASSFLSSGDKPATSGRETE